MSNQFSLSDTDYLMTDWRSLFKKEMLDMRSHECSVTCICNVKELAKMCNIWDLK